MDTPVKCTLCILLFTTAVTRSVADRSQHSCKNSSFSRILNEDIAMGSRIFTIPIGDVTLIRRVTLEDGNENERFAVSSNGVISVAKLLDYDITKMYCLLISVDVVNGSYPVSLSILVNDVTGWPPVFNESCAIHTNQTNKGFLYDFLVTETKTPLQAIMLPRNNEEFKNSFNADTTNSECSIYLYFATQKGKSTMEDVEKLKYDCSEIFSASSLQVFPVDGRTLSNPHVNPEWFEKPLSEYVFVIIKMSPMRATTVEGELTVFYQPKFNILSTDVTVIPIGCPKGKYGFACNNDCVCQNGAECHAFNGACKCKPGWKGPACDISSKLVEIIPATINISYGKMLTMCCFIYNFIVDDHHDIVWYKGKTIVDEDDDPRINFRNNGDGNSTVTIDYVTDDDAGIYECEVTDSTGQKHRAWSSLTVKGCPTNKWGTTCTETCNCQHSTSCDRYEGCLCLSGWNGTTCSVDVQMPRVVFCPDDMLSLGNENEPNVSMNWVEPQFTDNSDRLNVTSNFKPGDKFGYGSHHVVYTAIDGAKNEATCDFVITITEQESRSRVILSSTFIGVISALASLCLLGQYLVYKYRHEIQTIIADKFQAYEDDDQRKYDAFVSVKGDTAEEEFVYKVLLPTLEEEHGFHLCVHHRDFTIGEAIVENIVTAIRESRRTILVLSPSFVESEWCDYELALAHTEMISLRQKLIPIMFDDITRMANLGAGLQSILNTITYIEWPREGAEKDVRKFWKRLVKAMPKRRNRQVQVERPPLYQRMLHFTTVRNCLHKTACCNRHVRHRNDSVESDINLDDPDAIPLLAYNVDELEC
ncbi:uncharacterized protein [Ptychodera flava]|uniref:uncharacterized protein n=1 Tax=Ptychodera flava TaxID=63121 RepID=UPI00396A7F50